MATDKLGLYNAALRLCKARALANLNENVESRRVLDGVWADDPVKYCLEQGQWQWASRAVKLSYSNSVAPDFGFQRAFEKPADWVRLVAISTDEYFTEAYNRFSDEAGFIFADIDELYVKYVSDDVSYGRNYALWPKTFEQYVTAFIASEAVGRLTDSDTTVDKLEDQVKRRLSAAQNFDGVNRPVAFPPRGTFVNARHGRFGMRYDDRRR